MNNKENSFGDLWWHRTLNLVFYGSYIVLFFILVLAAGGIGYAITESGSFSNSLGFLISEATSIAILGFCILILETIRFIFFYIYTNKKDGFKKDLYKAFRRKSTIIVLILIILSVGGGYIYARKELRENQIEAERYRLQRANEEQTREKNAQWLRDFRSRQAEEQEKKEAQEALEKMESWEPNENTATDATRKQCESSVTGDYNSYYNICGVNESCLEDWLDMKGYTGNKQADIEKCIEIRS